jgi:hypothetical protein
MPAPIAVFAYNRPQHLLRTLQALAVNDFAVESELTIFCDGPRTEAEKLRTDAVQETARATSGFNSLTVITQDENQGLAASIINGVTRMLEQHGTVIVLEDDLVTAPYFLRFMNEALDLYADVPEVGNIHGWCFPTRAVLPETFFLPGGGCWGWATWRASWECLEWNPQVLHSALKRKKLLKRFNRMGNYDYSSLLMDTRNWATRRYASMMLLGQLTLTPGCSLVNHEGDDGSGTNCGVYDTRTTMADHPIDLSVMPPRCVEPCLEQAWNDYFKTISGSFTLRQRLKSVLPDAMVRLFQTAAHWLSSPGKK